VAELIQLASPRGALTMNVIFVHGLNGDPRGTWTSPPRGVVWPKWLAEDIEGLAVWSVGYEAPVSNWSGSAMELSDRAANVLSLLLVQPDLREGQLTFVGHSLGGLVIKQVLRKAADAAPAHADASSLALTEVAGDSGHIFVVEAATEVGRAVFAEVPHRSATQEEVAAAELVVTRTAASMGREMYSEDVRELLLRNLDNPRWNDVAQRCLTCANCTMVCPTCFCTSVEDSSDLTGAETSRSRRWDSCFTTDFSYIHGGSVRASSHSRYRQWMTHKLATWFDQFGTSGCVGCGRCITWCPVGIDITEEVRAIRDSEQH